MKKYVLTPELYTGNELIDSEHQRIIEEANGLMEACNSGRARERIKEMADFLVDYVGIHFSDEESLQTQYNYPNYEDHCKFHEWYKKELQEQLGAVRNEKNDFALIGRITQVMDILLKHIQSEDKRVAKWVREQQGRKSGPGRNASRAAESTVFRSSYQAVEGEKHVNLRQAVNVEEMRNILELFTASTGFDCAMVDLSGAQVIKTEGFSGFSSRYSQGKHQELIEFTKDLVLGGYRVGSLIGGAVRYGDVGEPGQERADSAGQLLAELVNQRLDHSQRQEGQGPSLELFREGLSSVQEAIRQIKSRAKGLEQTATMEKMLSLNAAIEAGRAGKAGVGFAVVAEEIGRMANESAAVYREIQELVRQAEDSMAHLEEHK